MKKYLAMLCAAMLCVCCLALAACGGSSSSSAASSGSDSAASASASSAAQPTFTGDWKFAAMEYEGLTMVGDLSAIIGEDFDITMTIKDDGTGTMTMQDDSADFKWTQKDASTITITVESDDSSDNTEVDVTSKDGALFMTAPVEDMEDATVIFTADGKYANAKEIDVASATPIKSADELVGDWTMCGVYMMGVSLYGDPADLAAIAGDTDISASFTKDGKVSLMGEDMTFTVEADGAFIGDDTYKIPVKSLDGDIVIDLSDMIGMDMAIVFGK